MPNFTGVIDSPRRCVREDPLNVSISARRFAYCDVAFSF